MTIEQSASEAVSRRGFLSAASVGATGSFLAGNAAAATQISPVAQQAGEQPISVDTFGLTQAALRAQADFAGEITHSFLRDIETAIVKAQNDPFKAFNTALDQLQGDGLVQQSEADVLGKIVKLLLSTAHSRNPDRTKLRLKVKSLAQEIIGAEIASPTAVAIARIAEDVAERAEGETFLASTQSPDPMTRSDKIDTATVGGAVVGAGVGAAVGGVPGAIAGAVVGGIIGGVITYFATK